MNLAALTPQDKTNIAAGLVILALCQFLTAMYLFGRKPSGGPKKFANVTLRLHRIFGYVFLLWLVWVMGIGVDFLARRSQAGIGYEFHGPRFFHAFLAVVLFLLVLLKISFIRIFRNYRRHAQVLGFILTVGTIATWLIAGWFYMISVGGPVVEK